jgi:hypothetical protein
MGIFEIVGICSAVMTLTAFVANEYGVLSADSITYDLLNFLSSIGLLAYAIHTGVVPFVLTNTVWGLVSGIDVAKYLLRPKGLKRRRK